MIEIEEISRSRMGENPAARVEALDWQGIGQELDQQGNAMIEQLLSPEECREIAGLYPKDEIFRSRVVMGRHGFGRGEYKYFSYPLPDILSELRTAVYSHLVPVANRWNEAMGIEVRYPKWAEPLREALCENMERIAADNAIEIEFVRSRKSFWKEDRVKAVQDSAASIRAWCAFFRLWSRAQLQALA